MTRTRCPNYPPQSCPPDCPFDLGGPCQRGQHGGALASGRYPSKVPTLRPPAPPPGEPDDEGMVFDFGTDKALYVPPGPGARALDLAGEITHPKLAGLEAELATIVESARAPSIPKRALPEFIATTQIGGYFKGDGHRYVMLSELRALLRAQGLATVDLAKVEIIANPPSEDQATMAGRYTVLLALCRGVIE